MDFFKKKDTQLKIKSGPVLKIFKIIFFLPFIFVVGMIVFFLPPTQGILGVISGNPTYSEGVRVGQVIKFSDKGYFFKTYEGELLLTQTGNASVVGKDSTWHFSVPRESEAFSQVISDINKSIEQGSIVKIRYEEKWFSKFWNGSTKYYVTKVDFQ